MRRPDGLMLAHSSKPDKGIPHQTYLDHVEGVKSIALKSAMDALKFYRKDASLIVRTVDLEGEFHDIGKLILQNQEALWDGTWKALPYHHADAAYLVLYKSNPPAAINTAGHHRGLFDHKTEEARGKDAFRDLQVSTISNACSKKLVLSHFQATGRRPPENDPSVFQWARGLSGFELRFMLSCLVDGDHTDTARHYNQHCDEPAVGLRASERLAKLDAYVAGLSKSGDPRSILRDALYKDCRRTPDRLDLYFYCMGVVGSGKTTSTIARALLMAMLMGLRRIFVVLPMTSLIDQTVKVLREALCLPGEKPSEVVAAHHHKVEFDSPNSRHLSTKWECPIIVTTSVQMFETLAGCTTRSLRKLHNLPGSVVVIDESDAVLPTNLWHRSLHWIRELHESWSCRFIFSSGTMNRIWEIRDIAPPGRPMEFASVCLPETDNVMSAQEKNRVSFKPAGKSLTLSELCEMAWSLEGPVLVVMGTIFSAAAVARMMASRYGKEHIEHISTALLQSDREQIIERVKKRSKSDERLVLVGTTVASTGQDMSFCNGMVERMSFRITNQFSGRINRHCHRQAIESVIYDFEIVEDEKSFFVRNPGFVNSAIVAKYMFNKYGYDNIGSHLSTEAFRAELEKDGLKQDWIKKLEQNEHGKMFRTMAGLETSNGRPFFRVIPDRTELVVISPSTRDKIVNGDKVSSEELQRNSVSMSKRLVSELGLLPIEGHEGDGEKDEEGNKMYSWDLPYDPFLGYMAGVFERLENNHIIV